MAVECEFEWRIFGGIGMFKIPGSGHGIKWNYVSRIDLYGG